MQVNNVISSRCFVKVMNSNNNDIDSIDNKYGLYKVRLGSQDQKRIWKMKRQRLSRNYTTEIDDILIVR